MHSTSQESREKESNWTTKKLPDSREVEVALRRQSSASDRDTRGKSRKRICDDVQHKRGRREGVNEKLRDRIIDKGQRRKEFNGTGSRAAHLWN